MELSEVTKVIDLVGNADINEYLDLGWKIITFYKTSYTGLPDSTQTPHFVIGWVGADPKFPVHEEVNQPW